MAAPGLDLLKPRNNEDAHAGSGTQSLSSSRCNHMFGVHDLCGIHNVWYCPFLLGLTSSKMDISEIFHVTLRVGLETRRLSGG